MLHLLNLEEIESHLLKIPALVRHFEDRGPEFVSAVKAWLVAAEDMLVNNRLAVASEIAVCRGALISAERGFPNGPVPTSRSGTRHLKEAQAASLLKHATNSVTEAIRSRRSQIDEAERVMMQMVAVAGRLGLIPPESGQERTAYLQSIVQAMSGRGELASFLTHVTGLLGNSDTLIILDRSLASLEQ
jgi:hypothetical protein